MSTLNEVQVQGRLGADPELKYTPNGKAVVSGSIAIDGATKESPTIWLPFTAWEKTAENLNEYFGKGKQIILVGSLASEEWNDKETGAKRTKLKMVVRRWHFSGSAKDESPSSSSNSTNSSSGWPSSSDAEYENIPF